MYSVTDMGRLLLAVAVYVPLLILPGFAFASVVGALGWNSAPKQHRWLLALVVSLAILPTVDSLATQLLGLPTAITLNISFAAVGAVLLVRSRSWPNISWRWLVVLAIWLTVVVIELIDIDWRSQLYQSIFVYDMVKHSAIVRAIEGSGAPPIDPFFLRSERSGYYYFFYTVPAILVRVSGRLVDARAAFSGLVFWVGLALFGLVFILLNHSRLMIEGLEGRFPRLIVALLACTGLSILPVVLIGGVAGIWYQQIDWWNEEVTTWVCSLLFVPHHVTALIASWVGLTSLAETIGEKEPNLGSSVASASLAGVSFATCLGASVWVALVTVATVACLAVALLLARRWKAVAWVAASGALTLAIDSPAILDLVRHRTYDGLPIGLTVRAFSFWDLFVREEPARSIGRFAFLPLNYFLEFGVFAVGAWMFWQRRRTADVHSVELARLLTLGAIVGLLVATFLRSTVISNDLGMRAMLYPQIACLIWTAVAFDDSAQHPYVVTEHSVSWFGRLPLLAGSMLLLGYLGVAYVLVCARLPSAYFEPSRQVNINVQPTVDHDLRAAYEWANDHLPSKFVMQHNPAPPRVFDFGLYGNNRVAVSDEQANLFGASRIAVHERLKVFADLFRQALPPAEVRKKSMDAGADALVVTSADPVWSDPNSWVWMTQTIFQNDHVRIISVQDLGARSW
jgi:hypothetical protein